MSGNIEKTRMLAAIRDGHKSDAYWGCGWSAHTCYRGNESADIITLVHYGTPIAQIRRDGKEPKVGYGAYSATDREGINTLFYVFDNHTAHVHIKNFTMIADGCPVGAMDYF